MRSFARRTLPIGAPGGPFALAGRVTRERLSLGRSGETAACAALERRGYAILARGYRSRAGEIDIVAADGPTIAFVEVKTRTGAAYGAPAEAVTPLKQRHIRLVAEDYLARHRLLHLPCRFDVVSVTFDGDDAPKIEVIQSAFDVSG